MMPGAVHVRLMRGGLGLWTWRLVHLDELDELRNGDGAGVRARDGCLSSEERAATLSDALRDALRGASLFVARQADCK
jgi:hypothetical protein